jgi:hypothetical protein
MVAFVATESLTVEVDLRGLPNEWVPTSRVMIYDLLRAAHRTGSEKPYMLEITERTARYDGLVRPKFAESVVDGITGGYYDLPLPADDRLLELWCIFAQTIDGAAYRVAHEGATSHCETPDITRQFFRQFLDDVWAVANRGGADNWQRSSEDLLELLEGVLSERASLEEELQVAYASLEKAEARIRELQLVVEMLKAELHGMKTKADPSMLANIALIVVTLLAPIAAVLVAHSLESPVNNTIAMAQQVQVDCGDTNIVISPGNQTFTGEIHQTLPKAE